MLSLLYTNIFQQLYDIKSIHKSQYWKELECSQIQADFYLRKRRVLGKDSEGGGFWGEQGISAVKNVIFSIFQTLPYVTIVDVGANRGQILDISHQINAS